MRLIIKEQKKRKKVGEVCAQLTASKLQKTHLSLLVHFEGCHHLEWWNGYFERFLVVLIFE